MRKLLALAVIALIAVSVVAGAIVVSNAINNMPWNEFGDYNTDMTVQNCSTYTSADLPAPTGQKYVMVTAFIHSDRQGTLPLSPAYFLLMTAQGGIYAYSALVPNSVPASIASGSGASVSVGFLIPEDATPVDLRLMLVEDWGGHVDAAIL